MADFAGTMKEAAFATSPREFDLSYSTTLEEIFDKLNARRTAFQMPFQIKGGVAGQRIVFEKEPNLDVTLWLYLSNGTHIRIQPVISEAKASVGGVRVDKNSALRKGVKGATIGLATDRGGYIDAVADAVQKILSGEPVADYIPPAVRSRRRAGLPRCSSASSAAGSASTASMSARSAPAYCSCLPPGFSASE